MSKVRFIRMGGRIVPIKSGFSATETKNIKRAKKVVLAANVGVVATAFSKKSDNQRSKFQKPLGLFKDSVGASLGAFTANRASSLLKQGFKTKAAMTIGGAVIGGAMARLKGTIIKHTSNFAADKTRFR